MSSPVAVYVHTPFCPSKCGYCDFNSYAMQGEIVERTVSAIRSEILRSPWAGRPAKTVFFGGGTPTYLSSAQLGGLLDAVLRVHPPTSDCEITTESNPGTVDLDKLVALRRAGFNRISLGAQSFDSGDLLRLGRVHDAPQIGQAVELARRAGFQSLNLDLIFGLPGQSARAWRHNLKLALSLTPDHLSLYGLIIEPNTRFYRYTRRGMLDLPDEDAQVAMYDDALAACAEAGLQQYEISNFARPGLESRHNLAYWRGEEYLAYGPGAVGCVADGQGRRRRTTNLKHPVGYSEAVEQGRRLTCDEEALGPAEIEMERVMLGLRLNEGVEVEGSAGEAEATRRGWLHRDGSRVCLTPLGRHFHTDVAALLV